jgi:hypothetical protein
MGCAMSKPDAALGAAPSKKNGGACGTAKFREETSKKADSATRGRIAAVHKVGGRIVRPQGLFCGAAFTKAGHGPPPLVAILPCTVASLGNDVRTPPPGRGVVVLHLGVAARPECAGRAKDCRVLLGGIVRSTDRRLSHEWHSFSAHRDSAQRSDVPACRNIPSARCKLWGRVPMGMDRHHAPELGQLGRPDAGAHSVTLRLFDSPRKGGVDGGVNPRKSGDDRKSGTRFAAPEQPVLAIFRSDANGCSVALCQRR